jgi:ribosomal protein L11 methyltransferase
MKRQWVAVKVEASVDSGELLGMLDDPHVTGAWQEEGVMHLYWPADCWTPEKLLTLRVVLEQIGVSSAQARVSVEALPEQDWNAEWARAVKPIRIGKRIVVRPSWNAPPLRPGDIELILDPKQAFGTGHHATTYLLIQWLEEIVLGGERVLDVGTGSGILAMVALRLGAQSALGIDCDPVAIDCAKEYAEINGFGPELELSTGFLEDCGLLRFDVILANLDRRMLLESAGMLIRLLNPRSTFSTLLVSGLMPEDRDAISAAFASEGSLLDCRERQGWLALRFAPIIL